MVSLLLLLLSVFSRGAFKGRSAMVSPTMLIVVILCLGVMIACQETDRLQCESVVKEWASNEQEAMNRAEKASETSKFSLRQLLFFLHIPRTGGRNYNFCFLQTFFSKENVCPHSYVKLNFDPRIHVCNYLSTHDDYSILSRFPMEKVSIVTNMRDPIQRFLGAYEFSVEVSARFLKIPRSPLVRKSKFRSNGTSTLEIWPWKYLVPWMQKDLFDRRDARLLEESMTPRNVSSVYDIPSHVMPLHEFILHPLAQDLIHNGATFQIAGISNNSILPNAASIRRCANRYQDLGHHVLAIAKKRLDMMLFVGITENCKRSTELFAATVGKQIFQKAYGKLDFEEQNVKLNGSFLSTNKETFEGELMPDHKVPSEHQDIFNRSRELKSMDSLLLRYQECSTSTRQKQLSRRNLSLEFVAPVKFTRQTRESIPNSVRLDILKFNSLDTELYEHAQKLFKEQENLIRRKPNAKSRTVLDWKVDETLKKPSQWHRRSFSNILNVSSVVLVLLTCAAMLGRFHLRIMKFFRVKPFSAGGRKILANNHHRRHF